MEADGQNSELIQRRESEEVEDIESSSDTASEDEQKPEESDAEKEDNPSDNLDQADAQLESAEAGEEHKVVEETELDKEACPFPEDDEKSISRPNKDDKHGKYDASFLSYSAAISSLPAPSKM